MPLTFVTTAVKRVNHGGFVDGTGKRHATDYIVFNCMCSQRNKQSMYDAVYTTPTGQTAFKCKKCRAVNEVSLPLEDRKGSLIISPEQFKRQKQETRKIIHG